MRTKTIWRAWLLTAAAVLGTAGAAPAQFEYAKPDWSLPVPLYSTQPEWGGLYFAGGFAFYRQTNPLREQLVAIRGFKDVDGTVTAFNPARALAGLPQLQVPLGPGAFIGSRAPALDVNQLRGPTGYEPGFFTDIGWRFADGSTLSFDYMRLVTHRLTAVATGAAPGLNEGVQLGDSFLFSPVFNFPNELAGPAFKVQNPNNPLSGPTTSPTLADPNNNNNLPHPYAVYGIWNGASIMTEEFLQRFQQYEITYRVPVYETECYRLSGIVGPRNTWIWERYKWSAFSLNLEGEGGPQDTAIYTNIVSNYMWGVHAGCQNEWYLGHGFAVNLELQAALFLDIVKERAKYQNALKVNIPGFNAVANKKAIKDYTVVPELETKLSMMWYPTEGIQLSIGYDVMGFFNTVASPRPIDFDYSALNPGYDRVFRFFDGFQAGIALIF